MRTRRRIGYSLLELLVCVAIVGLLASIATVSYMGAVDATDVRSSLEAITKDLESYRSEAQAEGRIIEVEFQQGSSITQVTSYKETSTEAWQTRENDYENRTLLKRKCTFRQYRWPDGAHLPRKFTFYPNVPAQGGEVYYGTAFAAGRIFLKDGKPEWQM